jgi:two-component system, response regulator YesN
MSIVPSLPLDRRILIADDDSDLRAGVVELLGDLGWRLEFIEVENGLDALRILRVDRPHLALLDMHMPGHTGLEILTQLRRETIPVPCILISGEASEAVRKVALVEGARAVLRKPPEAALLRREVHKLLTAA